MTASVYFWGRLPATWAFLERDAAPWAGGFERAGVDAAFHRPWDPLRRGLRVTTYRGRLYAAYAEDRGLPCGHRPASRDVGAELRNARARSRRRG